MTGSTPTIVTSENGHRVEILPVAFCPRCEYDTPHRVHRAAMVCVPCHHKLYGVTPPLNRSAASSPGSKE